MRSRHLGYKIGLSIIAKMKCLKKQEGVAASSWEVFFVHV